MDIDKIAAAIEVDAGVEIAGLKDSLREMQLGKVAMAYTPEQLLVTTTRRNLNLSQVAFAHLIDTPLATLRDWEQGRFKPPGGVICLLRLLTKRPDVMHDLAA
jgi:putative transcriptional regulator